MTWLRRASALVLGVLLVVLLGSSYSWAGELPPSPTPSAVPSSEPAPSDTPTAEVRLDAEQFVVIELAAGLCVFLLAVSTVQGWRSSRG